ncbi:protein of unknown function DUF1400 [Gloeothece citriformis PCC 7424]|uniref:DUF1400 domain-containing protein n=1 Tax=Gloeothece citriformis (strain PCC 7424) TaxID=65393 RepID=B7KAD5_GLOC7|nr:alpha/beta hydrolase [Gloeothece citriformis]ACK72909.1 protein of unknown function DUF1400 [Gloeothece citriformis PCC 7424]
MSRIFLSLGIKRFTSLSVGVLSLILTPISVAAAERIYFSVNTLRLSLGIEALELFAADGTINKELEFYLQGISDEDRARFRTALLRAYQINPVQLSRFFRTPTGEAILKNIGELIQIQGGQNGQYAIRGALIQAASEPEGLTILGFLQKFPTNIQLDTNKILLAVRWIENLVQANQIMVQELDKLSEKEALKEQILDYSTLPDIRKPGQWGYQQQRLTLQDPRRQREFYVDLYYPQHWPETKIPIVIFSHGLASRPDDYDSLAKHLASYGYLVALPQHPGSDFSQVQAMLQGYSSDLFKLSEFIDRPKDISFVLDELERLNQSLFGGRLNLERVGAIGHSFGGYAVFALAGGQIDFESLQRECDRTIWSPNLSLLIQCRALDLPRQVYELRDPRIKAVVAVNPFNSGIFGAKGLSQISIPVFIIAGSQDPAAPLVLEQGQAFIWLMTPQKYLGLVKGQAHINFSKLDAGTQSLIKSFIDLTIADQRLIDKYDNAMILSFFEIYLHDNLEYRSYLQSSYADYISQKPFELYLINASSSADLESIFKQFDLDF